MRIMLIATNRHNRWMTRQEVRPLPIGLAYVAAYIDQSKHDLKVLDLMFSEDYLQQTEDIVNQFKPELIGISIRNLDNGSYINPQSVLPVTRDVITRIRGCTDAIITCGGPAFSILPEECFQYLNPDIGLTGDAADTFALLADLLDAKGVLRHQSISNEILKGLSRLSGVIYRQEGNIQVAEHRASSALTKAPRLDELDLSQYRQAGFGVGVITKLGWYTSTVEEPSTDPGKSHSEQEIRISNSVEQVVKEVKRLKNQYNLSEFFFIDQAFNQPPDFAKALCTSLITENLNIKWNTNITTHGPDGELISLMSKAGCQMVLIGGPVISNENRQELSINLKSSFEQMITLCDLCQNHDLPYSITQAFGELGETDETISLKLTGLSQVAGKDRMAHVNIRIGNRLLPGSPLIESAKQDGLIKDEKDLLMPAFYVDPSVRSNIVEKLQSAAEPHSNWHIM